MIPQEKAVGISDIAPDMTLNLELFLDDSFLEGEAVENKPIVLALHHSARGGGYQVVPKGQSPSL